MPISKKNKTISETVKQPINIVIPKNLGGKRIDVALAMIIPEISRNKITNWIKNNHVFINNKTIKPKDRVLGGENITIYIQENENELSLKEKNIPLDIIFEDEYLLIINKPKNLVVHPGAKNWDNTLLNGLLFHYPQAKKLIRAGIVHRLDKDTTGILIIAKTPAVQLKLIKMIQNKEITRIYRAIVEGQLPSIGIINKNIGRNRKKRTTMQTLDVGGKEAVTHFKVLKIFKNFSYIECKLETGRTHQIRVHLKSINQPIIGDLTYGSKKNNYLKEIVSSIKKLNRQALHAYQLIFEHPVSKKLLSFKAPIPEDFKNLLEVLNKYDSNFEETDTYLY